MKTIVRKGVDFMKKTQFERAFKKCLKNIHFRNLSGIALISKIKHIDKDEKKAVQLQNKLNSIDKAYKQYATWFLSLVEDYENKKIYDSNIVGVRIAIIHQLKTIEKSIVSLVKEFNKGADK
jgi:hypothetical protein